MPIVVYWSERLGAKLEPSCSEFGDQELMAALGMAERLRRDGFVHVSISSEMADSVAKPGVDSVEDGKTPSGEDYTWSKAHRGAGPR